MNRRRYGNEEGSVSDPTEPFDVFVRRVCPDYADTILSELRQVEERNAMLEDGLRRIASEEWMHRTPGVNSDGTVSTSTMAQTMAREILAAGSREPQLGDLLVGPRGWKIYTGPGEGYGSEHGWNPMPPPAAGSREPR